MSEPKYKWQSPREWLRDKIRGGNKNMLRAIADTMMRELDADQVQDLFQEEMGLDGYFDAVEMKINPDCPDCRGTGYVWQSTGAFSYRAPCLCNPEHGSHHR